MREVLFAHSRKAARPDRRRFHKFSFSARALAAAAAMMLLAADVAFAEPPQALAGNAPSADLKYQPVFDYDSDGCYPTPAIGRDGTVNGGLKPSGALNGQCHDSWDLDNTNSYSRVKCNNGWCAYIYGLYFEKDQALPGSGLGGHRHDWEHVVVWVPEGGWPQYVSASAHGKYSTRARNDIPWDETGTHPKIVYHKDGASTHAFRFAGFGEQPENHKGTWQFPPLVGWDNYPAGLRDKLTRYNFGSAQFGLRDGSFSGELGKAKPAGIPFDPNA